jgi:hypothetical protein
VAPKGRLLDGYLNEDEEAAELGVVKRTLRSWRQKGEGAPYVKVGKQVFYPIAGSAAWLKANEQTPVRSGKRAKP